MIKKGILGLGRQSTAFYLDRLRKLSAYDNSTRQVLSFVLYQIDFKQVNQFLPNQFEVLKPKITIILEELSKLKISALLVPNITLHEILDQIDSPIKLFHPVDLSIGYLLQQKITQVVIFGTSYTMNSAYLTQKFAKKGIKIRPPKVADQYFLDDYLRQVFSNQASEDEIKKFNDLIKIYSKNYFVILACTELSVYAKTEGSRALDMANLQIKEFLK